MTTLLQALRRPVTVLLLAAVVLVDAVVVGSAVADRLRAGQGTQDPASASARAGDLLDEHFPGSRPTFVLLATAGRGVDDLAAARAGVALTQDLAREPGVSGVASYWTTGLDRLRSTDGRSALVVAHLDGDEAAAARTEHRLAGRFGGAFPAAGGPLQVGIGGSSAVLSDIESTIAADLARSEVVALPLTLLVLVLAFGSAVAALLPLLVAALAVTITNAVLWGLAGVTEVSVFAQNLTTALGLGLAIDYALLLTRRFRDELHAGRSPRAAARVMLATAGRTVAASALTVCVALAGLLVFPLYFLRSFAYAGVSVVLAAAAASLLVLPAALVLLGHRVDALDLRVPLRRLLPLLLPRLSGAGGPRGRHGASSRPAGSRVVRFAVTRPLPVAVVTLAVLALAAAPVLHVRFGTADERQLPPDAPSRVVTERIRTGFPVGAAGSVSVVARVGDGAGRTPGPALEDYQRRLSLVRGAGEVTGPAGTWQGGRLAVERTPLDALRSADGLAFVQVQPATAIPDVSAAAQALARGVRAVPAPFPVLTTSTAAAELDTRAAIARGLPVAAAVVVLATLLLVFLLTGSVVLPFVTVLLNAASLSVMFGAAVWVFQDGHLAGPIGFTPTGFVDTALPVLMFCLAFGLSMDYGLFVLGRVREEWTRGGDARAAVVTGLRHTRGTVTAAAVVLALVLAAIARSRITNTMLLGWGAALAVVVDATLVRSVLMPAVLSLLGRWAWWAPAPLARLHRRVGVLEPVVPQHAPAAGAAVRSREPVTVGER